VNQPHDTLRRRDGAPLHEAAVEASHRKILRNPTAGALHGGTAANPSETE